MTVGQWDAELFTRFRAAKGPLRRSLANRLLIENEPLIKRLVDQLCGRGTTPRQRARTFVGGCQGFRDIPWDDAMQAGRIAFCTAIEQFDPRKGKISYYLLMKIRYELQRIVTFESRLARVPRGREDQMIPLALVGEQSELDLLSPAESAGIVEVEEFTPEDVWSWAKTGEWPESLEELRPVEPEPVPIPYTPERFVEEQLVFKPSARMPVVSLVTRAEECAVAWALGSIRGLLKEREVRPQHVRAPWSGQPVRGLRGVCLQPSFAEAFTIGREINPRLCA